MTRVDRLRAALASRGAAQAALAGRIEATDLPDALIELARVLVGDRAWSFVTATEAAPRRRAARR